MLKLFIVVALLFAVALGFHWMKDASGEVALTLGETAYAVDLTTAAIALLAVILITMLLVWLIQGLMRAPSRMRRRWRRRREERGRGAISQGLIAVAAGDLSAAERAVREASRRTPDLPLTRLLEAQTAQLKGDRAAARRIFQEMTEDHATRIAGLRGLYVEAEREGQAEAARLIAEKAREESPSSSWAVRAMLRHQTAAHDWEGALRTLSGAADGRVLDKATARRHRAVILTARAMDLEDRDPDAARHAALEAHELAPDLVPAAVLAGRLVSRQGDIRRATRLMETTWKANPHPELADAYLHVRAGDSASDRLKRAETLYRLRPHVDESRMAVARAAIDARDFARAREVLTPLLTSHPTQKGLFLMAELEEQETGDRGRAREWLARAARAPRDPVWTADGMILDAWAPASPVTGRLDTVEWKVPVAELQGPRFEIDAAELQPPAPPEAELESAAEPETQLRPDEPGGGEEAPTPQLPPDAQPGVAPSIPVDDVPPVPVPEPGPADPTPSSRPDADRSETGPGLRAVGGGARLDLSPEPSGPVAAAEQAVADTDPASREGDALRPPLPDDPGVSDDEEQAQPTRRFRVM